MGDVGMGASAKLAQQVITCLNRLSAYEGMRLAEACGIPLDVFQQAIHVTSAQGRIADNWTQEYQSLGDVDARGAQWLVHLFWKGLCPALELGHEKGLPMPATALVQQLFPWVLGVEK
jgi:3-hydroxyisobutyrate dehydrogenase-like beta-hydroxyacid dehydrogenase